MADILSVNERLNLAGFTNQTSIHLECFKEQFFTESFENLETMESGLLILSGNGADLESLKATFLAIQSIKSNSTEFGYALIASLGHIMQEILDQMQKGERKVEENVITFLLESTHVTREMLRTCQKDKIPDDTRACELKIELERIRDGASGEMAVEPVEIENVIKDIRKEKQHKHIPNQNKNLNIKEQPEEPVSSAQNPPVFVTQPEIIDVIMKMLK